MTDLRISELDAVADVEATDEFELARTGESKKITGEDLLAAAVPAAADVPVEDAGTFYTATDVEGVLQEIAPQLGAGALVPIFDEEKANANDTEFIIDLSGDQDGIAIWVLATLRSTEAAIQTNLALRFNGDTGNNYEGNFHYSVPSTDGSSGTGTASQMVIGTVAGASAHADAASAVDIMIPHYAGTAFRKHVRSLIGYTRDAGNDPGVTAGAGTWRNTAAITAMRVRLATGDEFDTGSRVTVYKLMGP